VVDAASVRIKNRIGKQMIQIDQHGCNHNQPCFLPVPEEHIRNQSREKKM